MEADAACSVFRLNVRGLDPKQERAKAATKAITPGNCRPESKNIVRTLDELVTLNVFFRLGLRFGSSEPKIRRKSPGEKIAELVAAMR